MSIKLRLVLSNIIMITAPIILFFFASLLLIVVFLGDIREMVNYLPESHNYHKTKQEDTVFFLKLKKQSIINPIKLMDPKYLQTLNGQLNNLGTSLIIRKNDEIYYTSSDSDIVKASELPSFGTETSFRNLEQVGEQTFAVKQHDFFNQNSDEISLFLLRDASPWNKFVKTFFPILLALCVFILVITNGMLSYLVSKSIIKPINRLKTAAILIKNGNLDHSLHPGKKDEIGQLTQAFEDMRLQLKESHRIQEQYEENRKELIAHISHDLKTPITSIKGYIEGIRDGVADTTEKRDRYLKTIYSKAVDLDHLINELFVYSKLDLGKVPFEFSRVNFLSYLSDYSEELGFDLHKKNITIDLQYNHRGKYFIQIDREKMKRVLANIIENSVKYMDKETKEIKLFLDSNEDHINLIISDNGPGIPKESIPYIFNQFYRAEQSRNKLTGGSGLGLAIAKMIVEEHHGNIQVESTLTVGTKISIQLPQSYRYLGDV